MMTEGQPTVKVYLTQQELELIQNFLRARQIYIPCGEKWGYSFWQPYMERMLYKTEAALNEISEI